MTAVLGQLLRQALPAVVVNGMLGSNAAKYKKFFSQATAAGYGVGEILDFLQPEEPKGTQQFRERIDRRAARGMATPNEQAERPAEQIRPGKMLSNLAAAGAPLAALFSLQGEPPPGAPPPIPPQPAVSQPHPNAAPQNKTAAVAKLLAKRQKQSPLSMESLREQRQQARLGEMVEGVTGAFDLQTDAPVFSAQAAKMLQAGSSPAEISAQIRRGAKNNATLMKELSAIKRNVSGKLEDVISQLGAPQAQPQQQAGGIDSILAEINRLIDEGS